MIEEVGIEKVRDQWGEDYELIGIPSIISRPNTITR